MAEGRESRRSSLNHSPVQERLALQYQRDKSFEVD